MLPRVLADRAIEHRNVDATIQEPEANDNEHERKRMSNVFHDAISARNER